VIDTSLLTQSTQKRTHRTTDNSKKYTPVFSPFSALFVVLGIFKKISLFLMFFIDLSPKWIFSIEMAYFNKNEPKQQKTGGVF